MSEWIKNLADRIKETDHKELLEKEHQLHVAKMVNEKGPQFWSDFKASLKGHVEQMRIDLDNQVLAGDLTFREQQPNTVQVSKSELPFVSFSLTANFQAAALTGFRLTVNPRLPPNTHRQNLPVSGMFRVNHENQLFVEMDEHQFHHGHELAKHLMELLFKI